MNQPTDFEAAALEQFGASFVDSVPGERVTLSFPNTDSLVDFMLAIRATELAKRVRMNSRKVNGENHLTIHRC